MSELPKREPAELVTALRSRAPLISGQSWEAPATAAMMNEAAEAIDQLRAENAALRAERDRLVAGLTALEQEWKARIDTCHVCKDAPLPCTACCLNAAHAVVLAELRRTPE